MTLDDAIERVSRADRRRRSTGRRSKLPAGRPTIRNIAGRRWRRSFVAALELARQGRLEIAQEEAFADCWSGGRLMDEFTRAVEAALFASDDAAQRRGNRRLCRRGRGRDRAGRAGRALRRPRHRAGRARRALAFPDRARPGAYPAPDARGAAPPVARGDRDAGDHRLSRAGQPGRDRGDPRRADSQGHARRADGGGLGAHRRAARGAGPAVALRDDCRVPDPFRARLAPRPAGDRRSQGRRPARSARRGGRFSFNWKAKSEEG